MREVLAEITARTDDVIGALEGTDLLAASDLPDWTRLTIACHLRYGARALARMVDDTAAGRPTSYYPGGRDRQRPGTLRPGADESPADVVRSLRDASATLDRAFAAVDDWATPVVEPPDNPDLGTVELARLAISRLTEVEVHGTDLGVGLGPWSEVLVRAALPMRLDWLNTRRSNHRPVDEGVRAAWLLVATDLPIRHLIEVDGPVLRSRAVDDVDQDVVAIRGTGRELLALLLGRAPAGFAPDAFSRALPGP